MLFKDSEYILENVVARNKENPRHFLRTTDKEIKGLKISDMVKLIFVLKEKLNNECTGERMWVTIKSILNDKYVGELTLY